MIDTAQLEVAYRLTSACCYQPDRTWQEAELFPNLGQALKHCVPTLAVHAECLQQAFRQTDLQSLLIDYAALFVGPGTLLAAPYGSVYLEKDRQVMGASTQAVIERYRSLGLELAEDFPELPDHIAVELEFCSYLLQRQLQNDTDNGSTKAEQWREQRYHFLQQHLGRWAVPFCTDLRTNAETSFYRHLADLIEGLVLHDLQTTATAT